MSDNYVTNNTENGCISVAEDVVYTMVTAAVNEVDGVALNTTQSQIGNDIAEFFGKKNSQHSNIKLSDQDGNTIVDILLMVKYGFKVTEVAQKVQDTVAAQLKDMIGLEPVINVHVGGISFERADIK